MNRISLRGLIEPQSEVKSGSESHSIEVATWLFQLGYRLHRHGWRDAADAIFAESIELAEHVHEQSLRSISQSLVTSYKLATLALEHGTYMLGLKQFEQARGALRRAVELWEALIETGASQGAVEKLAVSLSHLANAQRDVSSADAIDLYLRAISLWNLLLQFPTSTLKADEYRGLLESTRLEMLSLQFEV